MSVPIKPIPVVVPSPSILTCARPLADDVDWQRGISWSPATCVPSFAWPVCIGSPTDKQAGAGLGAKVSVDPFWIYTPLSCDWVTDGTELTEPAIALTEAHTAFAVADALWMGTGLADATEITLRNTAVDVSQAGADDLDDVVALLLSQYEQGTGGNGGAVIHMPSTFIAGALGGIPGGGRVCWPEGNLYRAALGSVVSPGPGYPLGNSAAGAGGFGPKTGPGAYKGNAIDEGWVYVTGPVEYAVTPVQILPTDEADRRGNPRQNRYAIWAERVAIVRFDPCNVYAALALSPAGAVS